MNLDFIYSSMCELNSFEISTIAVYVEKKFDVFWFIVNAFLTDNKSEFSDKMDFSPPTRLG